MMSIAWTSSAGGAVSGNPFAIGAGKIQQVAFIPNLAGTQPTDLYDVTMVDGNGGGDYLAGKGANLSNAAASIGVQAAPLSWPMGGTLDLVVANAGNAKTGTVVILVET